MTIVTSDTSSAYASWSLIERAAHGDGPARSVFARNYLPLLRGYFAARWCEDGAEHDIEDAVQETFVECFRPSGPLARPPAAVRDFRAYLFGVARNVARRIEERRRRGAAVVPADVEAIAAREDQVSRLFDREWARTLMRLAGELMRARAEVGGAAARLRVELLRLRFQSGVPIRDIATQWEMDPDAVHRAYARAREEFHACLRQVVRDHAVRTEADLDAECRRLLAMLT